MAPFMTRAEVQDMIDQAVSRQGALIRQLQGALGGRGITGGQVTIGGASDSGLISHGLGAVPAWIAVTPVNVGGGVSDNGFIVLNPTATTFQIHNFGTINGFYWVASAKPPT